MRAALYARVSITEQVEGHSLDAQLDAMRALCKKRNWQVVDEYIDAGISGTKKERPELQRLLDDAEQGRLDVVVVHAVDRFYRNLLGLLETLDRLNKTNVVFLSITEQMDFTTAWGKLTLAVLGTLAEIFIHKLSAETRKGKYARARKGLSISGAHDSAKSCLSLHRLAHSELPYSHVTTRSTLRSPAFCKRSHCARR